VIAVLECPSAAATSCEPRNPLDRLAASFPEGDDDTTRWSRVEGGWLACERLKEVRIRRSARTHASSLTSATGQTDPRGMAPHRPV
jgi:hypothetical protein